MSFENLPGLNVTLKDGGLVIPDRGVSDSILIVAPCLMPDAPDEPVLARSSNDLIAKGLGDFYVGGEVNPIAAEWKAATDGGARTVYVCALKEISLARAAELENDAIDAAAADGATLPEAQAKFQNVLSGSTDAAKLRRKFIYFYDMLMGTLLDFSIDHVVVKGVTVEDQVDSLAAEFFPEVPEIESFPAIGGMVISSYLLTGSAITYPLAITTGTNDKLVLNVGGTEQSFTLPAKTYDGVTLTVKDLADDLQTVIDAHVSNLVADVRESAGRLVVAFAEAVSVVTGASKTTATGMGLTGSAVLTKETKGLIAKGSFAKTVADYCSNKTLIKQSTLGYIGVRPPADVKVSTLRSYVAQLEALDTEISPYLQIVGSESSVILPGTNEVFFLNGATHYAALVSTLRPNSAPTNKVLKGVRGMRFEFSLRQLSKLTTKKIVTFRFKDDPQLGRQLVITDGITSAPDLVIGGKARESDYIRLSTLRITQLTIAVVRQAVEPFIGESNDMPQYNALNTAVKSALEKLREAGVIRGYSFNIQAVTSRLDQASVLLQIIPAFEMRKVNVEVNLTYSDQVSIG